MNQSSSFMPEDYVEKRVSRRTNAICLSLFAVVMVGVVGAFFVTDRQRSDVSKELAQVNQQFEEAARRLGQLDELQARKEEMVRKAKVTSVLIERIPRSVLLAELVNRMPATLSLLEFDMDTKVIRSRSNHATAMERARARAKDKQKAAAAEVQAPQTEVNIMLVGIAPTDVQVAQFMAQLGTSGMFQNVNLEFSEEMKMEDSLVRKFRINLQLNQQVDLYELKNVIVDRTVNQNPLGDELQFNPEGDLVLPSQPVASVPTNGQGE